MSVLQKIKKIGIWVLAIIFSLIIAAGVVSYIYKDRIVEFVTQELGSQINGEVKIGKIDISFFSSFPNVSIQLHDVFARSTPGFRVREFPGVSTDTALVAGKISFTFNIIDFFQERYIVQEIKIKNADVHVFFDSKGNHNWNFIKESNDTTQSKYFVELSRISFYKTQTQFYGSSQKIYAKDFFSYAFFSGKFLDNGFALFVDSELTSNTLKIGNDSYFQNLDLELGISIAQTNNLLQILSASIKTPFADVSTKGNVWFKKDGTKMDVSYSLSIPDIEELAPVLPKSTTTLFTENKLRGEISSKGTIKGMITDDKLPSLHAEISYKDGSIQYEKDEYAFSTHGILTTDNLKVLSHYSYSQANFTVSRNETTMSGTIALTDFERMMIDITSTISANLEDISEFVQPDEYTVKGNVKGTVKYKGLLSDFDSFTPDFFTRTQTELDISLQNVSITPPSYSPYEFSEISGNVMCANQNMQFDSIKGVIKGSEFRLEGNAPNMLSYMLFDGQSASFKGKLFVEKLNVNPFMDHYDKYLSTDTSSSSLNARIDFTSNQVLYDAYNVSDVSCVIVYTGNEFEILQASLKTLQGTYTGNSKFIYYDNNTTKFEGTGEFKKMASKDLFRTFNNFDQNFLKESQINGKISCKFAFSTMLDKDYNPVYPSMKMVSNILIEDGSIKEFEPFVDMGKKMKVEEFNTVTFSRIENTLKIDNDTLYIPNMYIKTNAFEMNFSGKHSLDNNQFNYYITLFMKKTLSNVFRKKNTGEYFGEIEQNTDGNIRVPIKIFGNPDKYSIEYDMKSSAKNVKQGFEKQKDDWRAILGKEPIQQTESGSQNQEKPKEKPKEKPIESGFEIEYD